jgi:chromosome condensin MukBEF ATPase and DNA-binding subunit MukB
LSNIPSVIKNLKLRITQLESYNAGLADESCKHQAKIAELEKALQRQTKRVKLLEPFLESEPKSQDIRDLEQQALACDWIYTKLPDYSSVNLSVITARRLELITQANTLRGKSEQIQSKSR